MASIRKVLYVGITKALDRRVTEHKNDTDPRSFTARYHVHKLVYFERHADPNAAIAREKALKHYTRAEKVRLVERSNPDWTDLSHRWSSKTEILPPRCSRRKDDQAMGVGFEIEQLRGVRVLSLWSHDHMNRLTRATVFALTSVIEKLACERQPLVITGNEHFFSAGADLAEIAALDGPGALEFARMGQRLMDAIDGFPAPVIAAIHGYCMGGGLDLALACDMRIAAPNAIFGHRGAALGLITGWGGTQRLPRLVGKGKALEMFAAAEKLHAREALRIGLVDAIADDPVAAAVEKLKALPLRNADQR